MSAYTKLPETMEVVSVHTSLLDAEKAAKAKLVEIGISESENADESTVSVLHTVWPV